MVRCEISKGFTRCTISGWWGKRYVVGGVNEMRLVVLGR